MAVNQKIQNQEPNLTKVSSTTTGGRMILRVTLTPEHGTRAVSLNDAFGVAAANYAAEDERITVVGSYIPTYANKGSSEAYKFPPEYWGSMHLAIVGVMPLTADGDVAILSAFITEDANEFARRAQLTAVKVENLSILKAGVFAQLVYDFSVQLGEIMFLATGDQKEQKFSLTRSRMFADWGVTSIPEIPTLNRYFDPVTQRFVPCSYWRTAGEMLPERAEEPNFTDAAEKKVEEPEVLIGGVEANGDKAAEAAAVIESSTEPFAEFGTEPVVEGSDKPEAKTETTEDQAATNQDQPATVASGSGQAPTREQIDKILAMAQEPGKKDLSPKDQAAVNALLKGMKPEQLGR